MDNTSVQQTAQSLVDFGALVVLAAICIVGAGVIIGVLFRIVFVNYRKLENKVTTLENGQRTALEQRLDASTDAIHKMTSVVALFTTAIERAPCGHSLRKNETS